MLTKVLTRIFVSGFLVTGFAACDCPFPPGGGSGGGSEPDNPPDDSKQPDPGDGGTDSSGTPDAPSKDQAPKTLGAYCDSDDECESGVCRERFGAAHTEEDPPPKTCSECRSHEHCSEQNLGLGCFGVIDMESGKPLVYHKCVSGELGSRCENNDTCTDDLKCSPVRPLGTAGMQFCGHCASDSDCGGDTPLCWASEEGYMTCTAEASQGDGSPCEVGERGDRACENFCGPLEDINEYGESRDSYELGICGACRTDADCEANERCQPGRILGEWIPPACVPKS